MINILDKTTIDKIAAGEVVERPASIVKELLENSIDAGASQITVEIKQGGIDLIRITDNGAGILHEEVKKAFLRHATSKIEKESDLLHLQTLGFRGEALSSIASVCRVEFITKTAAGFTGTRYCIEGGLETGFEEIGAPNGTTILCRDLFFNTPARRKFLKSANTEAAYIYDYVEKLALSHADIAFRFINNNQTRLQTYGNGSLKDIVYSIYGKNVANALIPMDYEKNGIKISGYIAKPEISKGNRSQESFFVNQRFIKDKSISLAIEEGYGSRLMQHQYPFTILYFAIQPDVVDVNVHPAKMQVRFSDMAKIYEATRDAVNEALTGKELIQRVSFKTGLKREEQIRKQMMPTHTTTHPTHFKFTSDGMQAASTNAAIQAIPNSMRNTSEQSLPSPLGEMSSKAIPGSFGDTPGQTMSGTSPKVSAGMDRAQTSSQKKESRPPEIFETTRSKEYLQQIQAVQEEQVLKANDEAKNYEQLTFLDEANKKAFRIVGQVFDTYWIIEFQQNMYIIDQHAAHEKVLYERFVKYYEEQNIPTQMMAPAVVLSVSELERVRIREHMQLLQSMGFELEEFGGNEIKINGVPSLLPSVEKVEVFKELLGQLVEREVVKTPEPILAKLASLSCKAAVKGNTRLSLSELHALLDELFAAKNPYTCPHGRPTIIEMSKSDLERKFKRII